MGETTMKPEAYPSWHRRIMAMGENLMIRQMPSEVTPETARRCYDAAKAFYEAVDADVQAAGVAIHELEQSH